MVAFNSSGQSHASNELGNQRGHASRLRAVAVLQEVWKAAPAVEICGRLDAGNQNDGGEPGSEQAGEEHPTAAQADRKPKAAQPDSKSSADIRRDHRQPQVARPDLAIADEVLVDIGLAAQEVRTDREHGQKVAGKDDQVEGLYEETSR